MRTASGVIFVNLFFHTMPLLAGAGFGPGTLTAIFIFIPVSIWIAYAFFVTGPYSYKALAIVVFNGVVVHAVLTAPMFLFLSGKIGRVVLIASQLVNTVSFILIPWVEKGWLGKSLTRHTSASRVQRPDLLVNR